MCARNALAVSRATWWHSHLVPGTRWVDAQPPPATCRRLAFNYLDDLYKEFMAKFRSDIESASRPYAFVSDALGSGSERGPKLAPVSLELSACERLSPPGPPQIKFDTFIQKTKKLYVDTRAPRNLSKVRSTRGV